MYRGRHANLKLYALIGDLVVLSVTYVLAIKARVALNAVWPFDIFPGEQRVLRSLPEDLHFAMLPAVLVAWMLGLSWFRTYEDFHRIRANELLIRLLKAATFGALGTLAILFAAQQTSLLSRSLFFGYPVLSFAALAGARWVLVRVLQERHRRGVDTLNLLVVGNAGEALPLIHTLERNPRWGIRVLGVVHPDGARDSEVSEVQYKVLGRLRDLPRLLEVHPVDQVYVTGRAWDVESLRWIADACEELGVMVSLDANFLGLSVAQAELGDFEGNAVLSFSSTPSNPEALAVKRLMDLVLSALALLALSPVFLITALAIKLDDPGGPVFFGQVRSGLYGRTFKMWKFRSMVSNAEALRAQLETQNEMDGPVFKITRDPRITRVGAFIRKTSIDELPQFWNVLVGEMSLVGPRPPIPAEVEKYERWQRRRLSMKPGITCIWQVSGRNNVDFQTWMKQDLEYIDNWSLLLDVKLLFRTIPAVLLGSGAR